MCVHDTAWQRVETPSLLTGDFTDEHRCWGNEAEIEYITLIDESHAYYEYDSNLAECAAADYFAAAEAEQREFEAYAAQYDC